MGNGSLKGGEAESEVASSGMAGDAELFQIEPGDGIILVLAQCVVGAADVFKRSGPSAAKVSHATIFHVPGCDAGIFQRVAKMAGVSKVVLGAPEAAVDEEDDGMRAFSGGESRVDELIWVLSVRKAQIGLGRFLAEDGFALHAEQYRTGLRKTAPATKIEQAQKTCSKLNGRSLLWRPTS
jgi:hypothetical protein